MTGSMNCASALPSPLLLVEAAVMFLFLQAPGVDLFSYPQMPTILPESSTSIEAALLLARQEVRSQLDDQTWISPILVVQE